MQYRVLIQWDDSDDTVDVVFDTDTGADDEDDDVVFWFGTPVVGEHNSDGWTVIAIDNREEN